MILQEWLWPLSFRYKYTSYILVDKIISKESTEDEIEEQKLPDTVNRDTPIVITVIINNDTAIKQVVKKVHKIF